MVYGNRKPQKNFPIPPKLAAEWDRYLLRRGTKNDVAGPVAIFLAMKLGPEEWGRAVEDCVNWLESARPHSEPAVDLNRPHNEPNNVKAETVKRRRKRDRNSTEQPQ